MIANLFPLATQTVTTGAGSLAGSSVSTTGIAAGVQAWRYEAAQANTGNIAIGTDATVNAVGPVKAVSMLGPGEDIILPYALASTYFSADAAGQKLMISAVGP